MNNEIIENQGIRRAAQYLRMSTLNQEFSLDNQAHFIKQYAQKHNYEIVHTYDDAGKSGVTASGRHDFNRLIDDVLFKEINIEAVLVYDVSRFGRFEDPLEGIYYKYLVEKQGVKVIFCADDIPDNFMESPFFLLMLMYSAGSYSKNLSQKVLAGHINLVNRGYYQGGVPGYGLTRNLVDNNNQFKMPLHKGERKSLTTDRVVLSPGKKEEIQLIKKIFDMFIFKGLNEYLIAVHLNREGSRYSDGSHWNRSRIHAILINVRYTGKYIYNRTSSKLQSKKVKNPESQWVNNESFFKPIISLEKFKLAQEIIHSRSRQMSDDEILIYLKKKLEENGKISGFIIDQDNTGPSSSVVANRFGGLINAYKLIGYTPEIDYSFLTINERLREKHKKLLEEIEGKFTAKNLFISDNKTVSINKAFTFSVVLSRCRKRGNEKYQWIVRLDRSLNTDLNIVVRMNTLNSEPVDYFILPSLEKFEDDLRFKEDNKMLFELYRFDNLDIFLNMLNPSLMEAS
ncbi:recombinase family protein [Pantoea agglomerans]|uniref:recombinase family protein n=1 Tax=Enterobacter agglomerans TaxID=549 RepID=UPI00289E0B5C|nr:recombinase family protein [Pantoea agglomerans]WNK58169.1 recombinase family protein [Pantoea agglomerans]WNK62585.1 recombinase family protein [Pantoea agglomerans]